MATDKKWLTKAAKSIKRRGTKGTFTKYCGGKVTWDCIKRGLNSSNPTTRKRAAFAKAVRSKQEGGEILDVAQQVAPLADFVVPGLGTGISSALGVLGNIFKEKPVEPVRMNTQPYRKGGSVSDKISLLSHEGYPQKQAVAIALDMKRRGKLAGGGYMRKKRKYPYGGLTEHEGADTLGIAPIQTDANSLTGGDLLSTITKKYQDGGRLKPHEWMKTPLNYVEERFFKKWLEKHGLTDRDDYDMRGAFKAGLTPDEDALLPVRDRKTGLSFLKPGGDWDGTYVEEFDEEEFVPKFDLLSGRHRTFRRPHTHARETWSLRKGGIAPIHKDSYEKGGQITYKKYNAPMHEQGGLTIDRNGNPNLNGTAEIEGQEGVILDNTGKAVPYVLSDKLEVAQRANKLMNKMKGEDNISKRGRKVAASYFKRLNEQRKYPHGGPLLKRLPEFVPPAIPTLDPTGVKSYSGMGTALPTSIPDLNKLPTLDLTGVTGSPRELPEINTGQDARKEGLLNRVGKFIGKHPGELLKGAAYLGTAIDAFQPYEREKKVLADFSAGDQLVSGTGASFDALSNEARLAFNKARELARGSSRNTGQFMNRIQNIGATEARELGKLKLSEKQYADQLSFRRAGREDMKAIRDQAEIIRGNIATSQNRAMRQDAIVNWLDNVNNLGTEITRQQAIKETVKGMNDKQKKDFLLQVALINAKNPNFNIDPKALQAALDKGNYEEVIRAISRFQE